MMHLEKTWGADESGRSRITAPPPIPGLLNHPVFNRVQHYITRYRQEVTVISYQARVVTTLYYVSHPLVYFVEAPAVVTVQPLHPISEIRFRRFDKKMVVVTHQAVSMQYPGLRMYHFLQDNYEPMPILVGDEYFLLVISSSGYVVTSTRELNAL
jgi:hypothetical protein